MIYWNSDLKMWETILLMFTTIVLILALAGCGGAGGGATIGDSGPVIDRATASATRSIKLNSVGVWGIGFSYDDPKLLQSRLEMMAKRDSVMIGECAEWPNEYTQNWSKLTPASLKSMNPNIKVYRYYGLMSKNPQADSDYNDYNDTRRMVTPLSRNVIDKNDWWLKDGDGNIVKYSKNGTETMHFLDVGKPGFKEAYLKNALDRNRNKGFDGFVLDCWHYSIGVSWFCNGHFTNHPMPAAYPTDNDWYNKAWKPFIEYVVKGLQKAGYRVIGNCAGEDWMADPKIRWQRSILNGVIYEQTAIDWGGGWLPSTTIERRINAIANDPLEAWFVDDGINSSTPEYDRKHAVSLATYYIGVPVNQDKRSYHCDYGDNPFWLPLWDFNIGTPAETANKKQGAYFWSRKFTNGIVLLNYDSSQTINYVLDRKYKDINGQSYTGSVSVKPHTAMILTVN